MLKMNVKVKGRFKERRMFQRLNIPLHFQYKLLPHKIILESAFSRDISGGGISFRLGQPLKQGAKLKVLLHFPGETKPVTAVSQVVWCRKSPQEKTYDIGIKHVKILPMDKERFVFLFCEMMINYSLVTARK
ncbi:MAG: PilZ domain-containing protein [Candidatus Omnitrophica bacterium]|nr:PilZ domain-containing protein [Candidatus Omnitrophota bacterium]